MKPSLDVLTKYRPSKTTTLAIVIFLIASLATIYPHLLYGGILGSGESSVYLNPSYFNYFSMWEDKVNFGAMYPHQSNIALYSIFWRLASVLPIHPSYTFIFLSTFLASLFFYICAKSVLNVRSNLILIPGALLYTFNVFRTLGPLNERLDLVFVFLPVFFLLYVKLLKIRKWKYVAWLIIISIVSSSMGANLPVFSLPYLLMSLYLLFYLAFSHWRAYSKRLIHLHIALGIGLVVVNLFWLWPLALELFKVYGKTDGGRSLFSMLDSGMLIDRFRFLGFWAWRGKRYVSYYYPFHLKYDSLPLLITTFSIPLIALANVIYRGKRNLKLLLFFNLLFIVSLFLSAGTKDPLGDVYAIVYDFFPLFRMYREPFTKFMPLVIFALSFNLILSLDILAQYLTSKKQLITSLLIVSTIVIINAVPLFNSEAMPVRLWNGAQLGTVNKVPDYWYEARNWLRNNDPQARVLIYPYSTYGTTHNWEYGANIAGNAADFILSNNIIRGWDGDKSRTGILLKQLYQAESKEEFSRLIKFFDIRYILVTNDIEWRYSPTIPSPKEFNQSIINLNLAKVATFGSFTAEKLAKIPNGEPNDKLRQEFYDELDGQPALILYRTDLETDKNQVFSSSSAIETNLRVNELDKIIKTDIYSSPTPIFSTSDLDIDQSVELKNLTITKPEEIQKPSQILSSDWEDTWAWPLPSVSPDNIAHKVALLRESRAKKSSLGDYLSTVDTYVWLGAKRIAEISTYAPPQHTVEGLLDMYKSDITIAIDSLKDVPQDERDEDYWGMVKKALKYMERSEASLQSLKSYYPKINKVEELVDIHHSFKTWVDMALLKQCTDNCYSIKPRESGEYVLFFPDTTSGVKQIKILNRETSELLNSATFTENEKYSEITYNLDSSVEYILNIVMYKPENILSRGAWTSAKVYQNDTGSIQIREVPKTNSTELPDGVTLNEYTMLKEIVSWEPGKPYKLSFDYNSSGGTLGVAIVEDILEDGNTEPEKKVLYNKLLNQYDIYAKCENKEDCGLYFEKTVKAGKKAIGSYLYLYNNPESLRIPTVKVENIAVEESKKLTPLFKIVHDQTKSTPPKVDYEKLSATEYKISITNASYPYHLTFIEQFHPWWKLYYDGKEIADKTHKTANGFANSWYIEPSDVNGQQNYELTIQFWPQKIYRGLLALSGLVTIGSISFIFIDKKKEYKKS